jgi:type II secretory pathway pseudopilin PulG
MSRIFASLPTRFRGRRRAAAMIMALVVLLVVGLVMSLALRAILQSHRQTRQEEQRVQAELLADAALSRAVAMLRQDTGWPGENWMVNLAVPPVENSDALAEVSDPNSTGVAQTLVEPAAGQPSSLRISITAIYPNDPVHRVQARRELTYTISPREEKP